MKNTKTKKVLSSILSSCLIMVLLFSTMIVSPAVFTAGAEGGDVLVYLYEYVNNLEQPGIFCGDYTPGKTVTIRADAPEGSLLTTAEIYEMGADYIDESAYTFTLSEDRLHGVVQFTVPEFEGQKRYNVFIHNAYSYNLTLEEKFVDGPKAGESSSEILTEKLKGEEHQFKITAPAGYTISKVNFVRVRNNIEYALAEEQYEEISASSKEAEYKVKFNLDPIIAKVEYSVIKNSLTVNEFFAGGPLEDEPKETLYGKFAKGETPVVTLTAPRGYAISDVSFLTAAGEDFVEYTTDIDYANPATGVYHIIMPDTALVMNVEYICVINSAVVNHIYEGGYADGYSYETVATDDICEGENLVFYADARYGYRVSEIFITTYTDAGDFVEVLSDVDLKDYGSGAYSFTMPKNGVVITITYEDVIRNISSCAFFDDEPGEGNYYEGPLTALAGDKIYFMPLDVYGYKLSEVYVVAEAGHTFSEVLEYDEFAKAYFFTMPDGDVTVNFSYVSNDYSIDAVNIFDDGNEDDTPYYQGTSFAIAGDIVRFTVDAPKNYKVSEVYVTRAAGDDFVEVLSVENYANAFFFEMPESDVTINIVYESTLRNVHFTSYLDNEIYDQWTVGGVNIGERYVFTVEAPENCSVSDVYAHIEADLFVDMIPVTQVGNAFYFEMPDCDADVEIFFKEDLFDVHFTSFIGDEQADEWTVEAVRAGERYVFCPKAPEGCVVEEVYAWTAADLFVNVIPVTQVGNAFYFDMPECDVYVLVLCKYDLFNVKFETYNEDGLVNTWTDEAECGSTYTFTVTVPSGYVLEDVIATIKVDDNFAEIIPLEEDGNTYSFTVPEGDVDITILYKSAVHNVTVNILDSEGNLITMTTLLAVEGSTEIIPFQFSGSDKYLLDDCVVTVDADPFVEVYNGYSIIAGGIALIVPASDAVVNIFVKRATSDIIVNYLDESGELLNTYTIAAVTAGEARAISYKLPGYENYILDECFVTVDADPFVEIYNNYTETADGINLIVPEQTATVSFVLKRAAYPITERVINQDGETIKEMTFEATAGENWLSIFECPDGYQLSEVYALAIDGAFGMPLDLVKVSDNGFMIFGLPQAEVVINYYVEPADVTVNYYAYVDGTYKLVNTETVTYGECAAYGLTNTPAAINGHAFIAWYLDGEAFNFETPVTANIDLIAVYDFSTFTVTFDSADGSAVPAQVVTAGAAAIAPAAPVKEDFIFDGWYLGDEEYDFAAPVTGDITLVAHWIENPPCYVIKFFYYVDDVQLLAESLVEQGGEAIVPETGRYGYTFIGWFDNEDGIGTPVTDFTNITADATYYAIFERNPLADYSFGDYKVTDSAYGAGFKELKVDVKKNNAEYADRDVYVVVAAQVKDGSTVLFYIPVSVAEGTDTETVSLILNSATITSVDMFIAYGEVDFSGSLNWIDVELGIALK